MCGFGVNAGQNRPRRRPRKGVLFARGVLSLQRDPQCRPNLVGRGSRTTQRSSEAARMDRTK
jgi:hypothetical protein